MDAKRHDDAIFEYSAALSLDPTDPQDLLIKRSKAYVANGSWENGLKDANKVRPFPLHGLDLVSDVIIRR